MTLQVVLAHKIESVHEYTLIFHHYAMWANRGFSLIDPNKMYKFVVDNATAEQYEVGVQYRLKIGAKDAE